MREWRIRAALVGAGPGRADLITVRGREWITRADVIFYDRLVDPWLLDQAPAGCRKVFVGKECGRHVVDQPEIIRMMIDEARLGRTVVRLKGGDPCVFGRGGEEAEALAEAGIPFEIVPGVTAAVGVAAYTGIPLTHRQLASIVTLATGQGAGPGGETRVLYMAGKSIGATASELLTSGCPPDMPALAVEAGTWGRQRSIETTVGRLAEDVRLNSPVLVIIGPVVRCRAKMNWYERRPLFGRRVLVPRSSDHPGRLAQVLDEAGAVPVEFTPVRFEPAGDIERAVDSLDRFGRVHFADPQSAEIFMSTLRDARRLAGRQVTTTGPFTAMKLKRYSILPDAVGVPSQGPVLWVGPGPTPKDLDVLQVNAYQEVYLEEEGRRLQGQELHAVAFPSSVSVRRSVRLLGAQFFKTFPLFSIGSETSRAISHHGLDVTAAALPSTLEGFVDAMIGYFLRGDS